MPPSTVPSRLDAIKSRSRHLYQRLALGDAVLAAGMLLLVVYYVATRGVFQGKASGDGWFGFQYLRAIFFQHTLDMKTVIPEYLPYFSTSGPHHVMPNRCPFGPVLVWAPFYLVAFGLSRLLGALHLIGHMKGGEPFFAWFTGLGTLAVTLVGYRAMYVLLSRHAGRTAARIGATVSVWATPVAWYAVTQPAYQHGLAFGLVALLVERWDAHHGCKPGAGRRFCVAGADRRIGDRDARAGGAVSAAAGRGGAVGSGARPRAPSLVSRRRGAVRGGAAGVLAADRGVALAYTGEFRPVQVEPLRLATPFIVVALFSTRGGLFPWSPIAYAATAGAGAHFAARGGWPGRSPQVLAARGLHRGLGLGGDFGLRLRRAPALRRWRGARCGDGAACGEAGAPTGYGCGVWSHRSSACAWC